MPERTKELGVPGAPSRLSVQETVPLGPSRLWQFTETPSAQVMPTPPRPETQKTADSRHRGERVPQTSPPCPDVYPSTPELHNADLFPMHPLGVAALTPASGDCRQLLA